MKMLRQWLLFQAGKIPWMKMGYWIHLDGSCYHEIEACLRECLFLCYSLGPELCLVKLTTHSLMATEYSGSLQPPEFVFISFAYELDSFIMSRMKCREKVLGSPGVDTR